MGHPLGLGSMQQQGPQEEPSILDQQGALGGGISPSMMESAPLSGPAAPATSSSPEDLMKLIGLGGGWGTTDEGGLASHAYPSSSGVPYAYGLPNMLQEVMTGEPNDKQMAPDAPYSFPYKPPGGASLNPSSFVGNDEGMSHEAAFQAVHPKLAALLRYLEQLGKMRQGRQPQDYSTQMRSRYMR